VCPALKIHAACCSLNRQKCCSFTPARTPDGPINKFKLKFINEKLKEANTLLQGFHKPFSDFEAFDEADLPTNSDVVLILSQYLDCLEGFRSANIMEESIYWYWKTDGSAKIKTHPPSRFKRKGDDD
jgi:hypothetical protein